MLVTSPDIKSIVLALLTKEVAPSDLISETTRGYLFTTESAPTISSKSRTGNIPCSAFRVGTGADSVVSK